MREARGLGREAFHRLGRAPVPDDTLNSLPQVEDAELGRGHFTREEQELQDVEREMEAQLNQQHMQVGRVWDYGITVHCGCVGVAVVQGQRSNATAGCGSATATSACNWGQGADLPRLAWLPQGSGCESRFGP